LRKKVILMAAQRPEDLLCSTGVCASILTKRDLRIDARRSTRRKPTRRNRHGHEDYEDNTQNERVSGRFIEQKRLKPFARENGAHRTDPCSN
jgi:hypothetical protein